MKLRKLIDFTAAKHAGDARVVVAPEEIEILQTGEWNTPYHGHFVIDREDLDEYVQHFNDGTRKGVPIDLEHNSIGGAVGWVESLEVRDNDQGGQSLWAKMSWTPKGEQLIADREYRFFSPEFADEDYEDPENAGVFMDNVLIGGGLTNRPLFKNLTAIAANDGTGKPAKGLTGKHNHNIIYLSEEHNTMDLQELLAKKTEDLTPEEKAFIVEHKGELTEQQVTDLTEAGVLEKEGGDEDETPEQKAEREKQEAEAKAQADADAKAKADADAAAGGAGGDGDGDGNAPITASEAKKLREDAALGRKAHAELEHRKVTEHVSSMLFNEKTGGKLPITAKDKVVTFYESLNEKQRKQFNEIVEKMPELKMFGEIGDGGAGLKAGSATEQVMQKAEALVADEKNKGLTLAAAKERVLKASENKDLAEQYKQERKEARESK